MSADLRIRKFRQSIALSDDREILLSIHEEI
jgi:hypothetical protein